MSEDDNERTNSRADILGIIDGLIENISKIRKIFKGVSISALILAPLAIALSIYLLRHPTFFSMLKENDFGIILSILLISVITISCTWIFVGIRQYRLIGSWNRRYKEYLEGKEEIEKKIAANFGLSDDETEI